MDMKLECKMMDGYAKMKASHANAIDGARKALAGACKECWFRLHGGGCEGNVCTIHRMTEAISKFDKSRQLGHLDNWNWYTAAKHDGKFLFVEPEND